MPRQSKQAAQSSSIRTLVVDNGAYSIKAGFASDKPDSTKDCRVIPNCIARGRDGARSQKIYVGDQLDDCKDFAEMAFRRPVEKGYLVSWDGELDIWKQAFFNKDAKLHCDPSETNLILAEAPNCPQALQASCDQVIFEELEFVSAYRCMGPILNAYNDIASLTGDPPPHPVPAECLLLIDSGFSHTTVTPLLHGRPIQAAIRRLDIGGKYLTNYLKELISLRHFGLMDDPHLVSQIKEDACFISQDFKRDLDSVWKGAKSASRAIVQDYVLPDYLTSTRGHLRPHDPSRATPAARLAAGAQQREEFFPLGNERFVVPELLFSPSDIGMPQAGLAEIIVQSLGSIPVGLWPAMLANVIVVGGNARMEGLIERLDRELRALTPLDCVVRVRCPEDPIKYTWLGGVRLASSKDRLKSAVVTREEYFEHGASWTARRFARGGR